MAYRRRGKSSYKKGYKKGKRAAQRAMSRFMPMMSRVGIRK